MAGLPYLRAEEDLSLANMPLLERLSLGGLALPEKDLSLANMPFTGNRFSLGGLGPLAGSVDGAIRAADLKTTRVEVILTLSLRMGSSQSAPSMGGKRRGEERNENEK